MSQILKLGAKTTISNLCYLLIQAKAGEEFAKRERIVIEEKIAALVPTKDSGQKTVTLEDGSKVTVKRGFNYRADIDGIMKSLKGTQHAPPIKTKYELDICGYEWYRKNRPESFVYLSEFVTVTPKKVAVTLTAAKDK